MCFTGKCSHENWHGECRKKPSDLCPMAFETEEDYWEAVEAPTCAVGYKKED